MNKYHIFKQLTKQLGKLVVVALSSAPLFATALSAPALAEAKETLAAFDVSPVREAIGATSEHFQEGLDAFSHDATQFFDASVDDAIDTTNAAGTSSETAENDVTATEVTAAPTNDAIVVDGDTVTIQGDCTTTDIFNVMRKDGGAGVNATELHFSGSIVITTEQTGVGDSPFAQTKLQSITADEDASVSFTPKSGASAPTLRDMFSLCGTLSSIHGLSVWNVSNVTGYFSMSRVLSGCSQLTSLDGLENWDVSNLAGESCMDSMFSDCTGLASLDGLEKWNVSNVTGKLCMKGAFGGCSRLTSLDGLANWNVSKVTGVECMAYMFQRCSQLTSLDGLANWNVSSVSESACMRNMFYMCTSLTSLDGLANWNVSNVVGSNCFDSMFAECSSLTSLDGLANWNLAKAMDATVSSSGVRNMFGYCENLSSLTVNPNDGFQLDSSMNIPSTFSTGGNYWWPVKGANKGITTNALYDASKNTDTYGTCWVRSEENVNPYISGVVPEVTWTTIAKPYTGLNQTIGPDKVEVDGTELKAGVDYTVLYTKNTTQENAEVASPVVRDKGAYTAELYLQGKYVAQEDPAYTQTVYVTEPAPGPTPPGPTPDPTPGPTPDPTPGPTPASGTDEGILPMTGDTLATSSAFVFICIGGILLTVIVYKRTCRRD